MDFAQRTIDIARKNVEEGGRPFATVIVKDGEILVESPNRVAQTNDPTAHAEILAIRDACRKLGTEHLVGATSYVLAHPCPMCQGSLYYCSPDEVVLLTTRDAYEPHHVDDRKHFELDTFYGEFAKDHTERRQRVVARIGSGRRGVAHRYGGLGVRPYRGAPSRRAHGGARQPDHPGLNGPERA
ncbi:nucleoside deaminase [Streptomyces sp. NPDC127117]|uniref:nucleoside deaminase n=1 Tax=Streptomyces sp. NPDC127117 TaxID=3345368 RepID=UPI00363107C1